MHILFALQYLSLLFDALSLAAHSSDGKKGLDLDLNKSPPLSPQSDQGSKHRLDWPTAILNNHDLISNLVGEQPNLIGAKVEYVFPQGTTPKEKKSLYNKIQYARKVSRMIMKTVT